ncbi:Phosphatidylinositol/phosphatidylcholine transfer protein SFH2 [Bienertia sinuspersici]
MGIANDDAIKQFESLMEGVDESLKNTFENMHQGYPTETYVRFLRARDWNVEKAHKMLVDSLNWRLQNEIDNILKKPIVPEELYRKVRDSQLVGLSGFSKEGLPVVAVGVGHSTYDKASVNYYVQSHIQMNEYRDRVVMPLASQKCGRLVNTCIKVLDMTGLKISALNQIKLLTVITTIDDLNYPEKTDTYYIVNVPYIFSACWKVWLLPYSFYPAKGGPFLMLCRQVVRPLLQERTRKKIQVLQGCGKDELLKIMDYASLPHFCKREGSGSSRHSRNGTMDNCFSLDHPFHQELYSYVKQQAAPAPPLKQGSFHVVFPEPDPDDAKIAKTIESEFHRLEDHKDQNGLVRSMSKQLSDLDIKIN